MLMFYFGEIFWGIFDKKISINFDNYLKKLNLYFAEIFVYNDLSTFAWNDKYPLVNFI